MYSFIWVTLDEIRQDNDITNVIFHRIRKKRGGYSMNEDELLHFIGDEFKQDSEENLNMDMCTLCGGVVIKENLIKGAKGSVCKTCLSTATKQSANKVKEVGKKSVLTLSQLKEALDKKVIGQEEAKKQLLMEIYKYKKGSQKNKNNAFLIGDSGVGKTHLVRSIADIFDVKLVEFDATTFSETGYKGKDVSEIIEDAYIQCGEDIDILKKSIIFIDEIDKVITTSNPDSANKVQQALLKMVEGSDVVIQARDKRGVKKGIEINTRELQFIVAGACVGLSKQVKEKHFPSKGIGFGYHDPTTTNNDKSIDIKASDLINYGFIPEFVGRFPLIIQLESLTKDHMLQILLESESSILKDYIAMFSSENIELKIENDAIEFLAEQSKKTPLGFRGVQSTLTKRMNDILYDSMNKKIDKVILDKNKLKKDDNLLLK